jgi:hypothetical protein
MPDNHINNHINNHVNNHTKEGGATESKEGNGGNGDSALDEVLVDPTEAKAVQVLELFRRLLLREQQGPAKIFPQRLDTHTKVSFMSSLLFVETDKGKDRDISNAVELAFDIDEAVNVRLKKFKAQHELEGRRF